MAGKKQIDLTGKIIGYTYVDGFAYNDKFSNSHWNCVCLYKGCGKKFIRATVSIKNHKDDMNCGCYYRELRKKTISSDCITNLPHGDRIKRIYNNMRSRCLNVKNKEYSNYGGRGITICDEWLNSKKTFYEWAINNGYRDDLTIDRIDNDGNYEPSNCRWVDRITQNNNTSRNKKYEYKGKMYSIKELSEITGINANTLFSRFSKGLNVEEVYSHINLRNGNALNLE